MIVLQDEEGVRSLEGYENTPRMNICGCSWITDLTPLAGCKEVILDGLQIRDVSPLANCDRVSLRYNNAVTAISSLKRVGELDISYCPNITDVSALTGVQKLVMDGCPGVKSLMALIYLRGLPANGSILDAVIRVVLQGKALTLDYVKEHLVELSIRAGYNPHLKSEIDTLLREGHKLPENLTLDMYVPSGTCYDAKGYQRLLPEGINML